MELLALLPAPALLRLRAALPSTQRIIVARGIADDGGLAEVLGTEMIDLIMVDPSDPRVAGNLGALTAIVEQHPWVPLVLYTPLAPANLQRAGEVLAQRRGGCALLLMGYDDHPERLRAEVNRLSTTVLAERMLLALEHPLANLPALVVRAIRRLFGAPQRFASVDDVASVAGVTPRHLHRLVVAAGIQSPRTLLVTARVIRAYQLLQPHGMLLDRVARMLRLEPRTLSRHIREAAGVPSAIAVRALYADEVITRCVRALYRPPRALRRAAGDMLGH